MAVVFLLACAIVYFANPNQYKTLFIQQFEKETGLKIALNGPIDINFIPMPHINTKSSVITFNTKEAKVVVSSEYLGFKLTWRSLFSDTKKIKAINAKNMTIRLFKQNAIDEKFKIDNFEGALINAYQHMKIPSFKLVIGKNLFEGNVDLLFEDVITKVIAKVKTKQWNMGNIGQSLGKSQDNILAQLLTLTWLKRVNAKIDIQANRIQAQDYSLDDANAQLLFDGKKINITSQGKISLGDFAGNFTIKTNAKKTTTPEISGHFTIKGGAKKNDMEGDFTLIPDKTPEIVGRLKSQNWVIKFIPHLAQGNKVFSSAPFEFNWYQGNAKIDFQTAHLVVEDFNFEQANLKLELTPSTLTITPVAKIAQGELSGHINIENKDNKQALNISGRLVINGANASEFIKIFEPSVELQGGRLDGYFEGTGQGKSVAELMAHLSGHSMLHIQQMTLLNKTIDSRYVDIFAALIKAIVPKSNMTQFECIAWKLDIQDGIAVAKDSIAIETSDIFAMGTGNLDLATEKLNFAFDIFPRSQANIEIGSLDNVAYLKGSLAAPVVESSSKGLIKEGGTLVLGIATGGLSLLAEKLFKIVTQHRSPCQEVLSRE